MLEEFFKHEALLLSVHIRNIFAKIVHLLLLSVNFNPEGINVYAKLPTANFNWQEINQLGV